MAGRSGRAEARFGDWSLMVIPEPLLVLIFCFVLRGQLECGLWFRERIAGHGAS